MNAGTSVYTLIGKPIGHSLSPSVYNFGFRYYGLNSVYITTECENPEEAINGIKSLGFKGFNITTPYKQAALAYVNRCSRLASLCGSINTVAVEKDGSLFGEMTDGYGFVLALQSKGIQLKGRKVEIVGAGGAGRALAVAAVVNQAKEVVLVNRKGLNLDKGEELASELGKFKRFHVLKMKEMKNFPEYLPDSDTDILVNASTVGMKKNPGSILSSASMLTKEMTVFDLVYEQENTELLEQAREAGCKYRLGGKRQLLFQAAVAFRLYTGLEYPVNEYLIHQKNVIFLVGFMGAGKSTVGKRLAEKLHTAFIDLDQKIEEGFRKSVKELFAEGGEDGFRKKERAVLQEIMKEYKGEAVVVATGGGTVLQEENYALMQKFGRIIYLDISFGEVLKRLSFLERTRPLLEEKSAEDIGILYRMRNEIYKERQDYRVDVDNRSPDSIANELAGYIKSKKK